MKQSELNIILENHKKWLNDENDGVRANLQDANLRDANLRDANLQDANLRGADLQDADLDFSCLPIWCGGLNFKIDEKQAKQLMYHIVNLMQYSDLDTNKIVKLKIYDWLKDSHLVTKHNLPILKEKSK